MPFIAMTGLGYEDIGTRQSGIGTGSAGAGVPYWGDLPEAYDTVVLAGIELPGLCSVKGKGYEMRRRHAKVAGKHGATTLDLANEPAEFVITVMMNTEKHLRDYEDVVPLFKPTAKPTPDKGKKDKTETFTYSFTGQQSAVTLPAQKFAPKDKSKQDFLTVVHPMLAVFRIAHCRVIKVTIPEQSEDKGMWKSEIHCIEEVMDGSRKTKPATTGPSITSTKTANDALLGRTPSSTNAGPPK